MTGLPHETAIGRVDLAVADLEGVSDFYESTIGLERLADGEDGRDLGVGDRSLVRLIADQERPQRGMHAAGLFHLAILVPTRDVLADALERLRLSGRITGASDHGVSEALYARDPEGNGVEVYRDRPPSSWEHTPDGGIRLPTDPLDVGDLSPLATAEGTTALPEGTCVGHVHLEVADLEAARSFYVDTLGFAETFRIEGAVFVAAGDYHHHVAVNVWNKRRTPASGRGLVRFEIVLPDAEAIEAVRERARRAGVRTERTDDALFVWDPDGIELYLRPSDENRRTSEGASPMESQG